jgi:PAS domain S-box-containing protein
MLQFFNMPKKGSSDDRATIDQRLAFMNSLFRYKDPNHNGLNYWRERIVFSALAVGMGLSLGALVPAVRMAVSEKLWILLVFDLIAFTVVLLLLVLKRISLELRTTVVLLITFLIGIVVICEVGFLSGGTAWLFCFAVLTGVLMGLRAALIAVALNAAAMIILAWMARTGLIGDLGSLISTGRAVTAIANFLLLNTVCAVTVAVLVNGLEAFNNRIQSATKALKKEQRNLVAARESLKQEVTERKESERAALVSERKYRLLAENIRDVIWTMDIDLKFTYVSPAVTQMLEWTATEFLDLTLEQIMTPDSFKEVIDAYERHYKFGEQTGDFNWPAMLELELYTKSGASVWTEVKAGFLLGADGQPAGILGAARDITERLRAQKEKAELLESLNRSRKMEALGTLAGGVAHDLNNVLSGIVSYPDLLLMDIPDDSPLRQPIETMRNSGKKAAAIVQDLLTMARRNVSVSEVMNLNGLVKEYLASPEFKRLKSYHPLVEVETVQDHKAFIDIESASDQGTIIALYLPVTDRVRADSPEPKALENRRGAGESVLVVDDVKEQREVTTRILKQLGYRAHSVNCGEEAVAYLEKNSVDMMLLDMIMDPGIDGLEAVIAIEAKYTLGNTPQIQKIFPH